MEWNVGIEKNWKIISEEYDKSDNRFRKNPRKLAHPWSREQQVLSSHLCCYLYTLASIRISGNQIPACSCTFYFWFPVTQCSAVSFRKYMHKKYVSTHIPLSKN